MRPLKHALRRFRRDDGGTMLTEAVLVLPLLIWAYMAMFAFWDTYKAQNALQKASYTVADMMSRNSTVNTNYILGLRTAAQFMTRTDTPPTMRFTSIIWVQARNRFEVLWSRSPGNAMPQLTTATLQPFANRIPQMTDGDTVILLEMLQTFRPALNVGIPVQNFSEFVITRPRFYNRIEFVS